MFHGQTKAALGLLTNKNPGIPRWLDEVINSGGPTLRRIGDTLIAKHLPSGPVVPDVLVNDEPPLVHSSTFESLDARCIRSAALRTEGGAG